jgi:OOP family OmpA-OmpF porin
MRRAPLLLLSLLAGAASGSAAAAELSGFADFPGAVQTHAAERALDSYRIPVGRFTETFQPVRALEGLVRERVLRLDDAQISSLEAIRDVEALLRTQGFARIFDCADDACGGFDFRFNTRVIPAPDMEVDLADFRYLATVRDGSDIRDHVSVLVSRVGSKLFVQLISVETPIAPADRVAATELPDRIRHRFDEDGHSVLDNVDFVSGASELSEGSDPMLEALATVMAEAPGLNIAIVGHTDNEGDAALNQELSEARAQAVVARLIAQFGVPAERLSAHGVGFLAPLTSNATAEGRRENRRVEAVVK